MKEKIFITGASGCVGHYLIDEFLATGQYELHLLIRETVKLKFDYRKMPDVNLYIGNLENIENYRAIIEDMNHIIHIATDWSDSDYAIYLNVEKTEEMLNYSDPQKCKRIIYFSTASILGKGNQPVEAAGKYGAGYVKSKYLAYEKLKNSPLSDRLITLFPTMVFGGDKTHPYSHISSGILPNLGFAKFLRFFYADASFHFIHCRDIAQITKHLISTPTHAKEYVLGNAPLTLKEAIKTLCKTFNVPVYVQFKIRAGLVFFLAKVFKITIGPWEKYCIENPDMTYDVVNPSSFGIKTAYPTLTHVLADIKPS
ncbi:MAG: nucleoside-diphosphate-sugar epimerase [Candidatus Marinamargulisbacteria bacterium]|jgi:nucleoside-diphosphate-sugar epimerase